MENLPEELLLQIVQRLDSSGPPSKTCAVEVPDVEALFVSDTPLKSLSCVTSVLRRLILPLLFRHLRINLGKVLDDFRRMQADHVNLMDFSDLKFLWEGPKLAELATSAAIYDFHSKTTRDLTAPEHRSLQWLFSRILRKVSSVSILAPPETVALLLDCEVSMSDAWAFNIPFQRVDISRSSLSRTHGVRGIEEKYLLVGQFWDEFSYHGHSCLPSYGTYHYFEKYPPCPFTAVTPLVTRPFPGYILGYNIVDFTYSVLFPHALHFRSVLHQMSLHFNKLVHFRLRLAPDPQGEVWRNLDYIGRGSLNLRDCWSEIEHCHDELLKRLLPGLYQLKAVTKVTLYDAQIPSIAQQLNTKFGYLGGGWERVDDLLWECGNFTANSNPYRAIASVS